MRRFKLVLLGLVPLLIGACHYKYTAPFFWKHQSSAAAGIAIGGFVLTIMAAFVVAVIIMNEWSERK